MKKVTILIPIHNRLEITKEGLSSLYKALYYYNEYGKGSILYSIIVIDDGSTDGSKDYIAEVYKDIYLLKGDGHLWWTGCINLGARFAINEIQSDYLLLWNDDIFPNQNYFLIIESLIYDIRFINTVIGSKIIFKNSPEKIWSVGGYFNKFSGNFGMKNKIKDNKKKIINCQWQPGMGTLIPVNVITSYGIIWDEKNFPQYHGDSDFTLQCSTKGIQIITYLDLIISNNTETTGFSRKTNLNDLYESFTSIKSGYNVEVDLKFYLKHGYLPFAFWGMFIKYFTFTGGYIKHSIFKRPVEKMLSEV